MRLKPYVVASLGLLAAASIRPEGWFVIPAALIYWVARIDGTSRKVAVLGSGAVVCAMLFAAVAPRLGGNLSAVGPAEMLRRGQTIWEYDGWRVAMPDDPALSSQSGNAAALEYGVRHPLATATLMAARLGVHAVHVRPYYSLSHPDWRVGHAPTGTVVVVRHRAGQPVGGGGPDPRRLGWPLS